MIDISKRIDSSKTEEGRNKLIELRDYMIRNMDPEILSSYISVAGKELQSSHSSLKETLSVMMEESGMIKELAALKFGEGSKDHLDIVDKIKVFQEDVEAMKPKGLSWITEGSKKPSNKKDSSAPKIDTDNPQNDETDGYEGKVSP